MPEFRDFKVSPVGSVLLVGTPGHGFSICNPHGGPLLTINYRTAEEAEAARQEIAAALANAVGVGT